MPLDLKPAQCYQSVSHQSILTVHGRQDAKGPSLDTGSTHVQPSLSVRYRSVYTKSAPLLALMIGEIWTPVPSPARFCSAVLRNTAEGALGQELPLKARPGLFCSSPWSGV